MSTLPEEVDDILFSFVRIVRHHDGRWLVALEPRTVWPIDNGGGPLPPGQCVEVGSDDYHIYNELDMLGWPTGRQQASAAGEYGKLWAGRPHFHSREAAVSMIMWWIKAHRHDLVQIATSEARGGRAWRAAHPAHPPPEKPSATWIDVLPQ